MSDMTDPDPELDELASAYLDDVASDAERARVDADPHATARVELLRSVRAQLAVPPPVAIADRDRHLLAALAVFDEHVTESSRILVGALPSGVHSLDEARARRTRRLAPVISIAAAGFLVAGVGILATSRGDDGPAAIREAVVSSVAAPSLADVGVNNKVSTDGGGAGSESPAVTAAPSAVDASALAIEAAQDASTALADAAPFAAPSADLTSLDQLDALVEGVADDVKAQQQAGEAVLGTVDGCPAQAGDPIASVLWQGHQAILYVLPNLDERSTAVVVDATSCLVLGSTSLAG